MTPTKMTNRIDLKLKELRASERTALVPYLTVGFPDVETSVSLVQGIAEAGADIIELGVPFSDPLADGPTIQRSSFQALKQGVTLKTCLDMVNRLRKGGLETPLVFMGYYNPLLRYGLDAFANDAADAGLDGLIVVDLPTEEVKPLRAACDSRNIYIIALLAPTSTDGRIAAACKGAQGFIYCISVTGITGARRELPSNLSQLVDRVRKHTDLPIMVGFGVSTRTQVEGIVRFADGVAVGSALIDAIEGAPQGKEVQAAKKLVLELKGMDHQVEGGTA